MSTNKESKKKTGGAGCLGCCSANAKPPKAARAGAKGTETAAPKDAAGATGEDENKNGSKNAEGQAGPPDANPSDKSLEEENLRGEAIVAGQQMKAGGVDPLARRHTLLLPQQARTGKTAAHADGAALKQALSQQFGIEYDDARSQSHGLVLTPSQHQQLQKIIENSKRRADGTSNYDENVPLSGRGGINGISTLEVQQALGLGAGAALNLGALLQHHDLVMNQGRSSLEGATKPGRGAASDREDEYMSGKKTPPRRNEDEAGKGSQQQVLALSDIKLNMQQQTNPNASAAGRKGGPAAGDTTHPQGGPSSGQFSTFDPQAQTYSKSSKARASVDRLPNSKIDGKYDGLGGALPGRVHGHSGPAGDGGAHGDAAARSLNTRPHSNLHVGSAPLAAPGAIGGEGSSKATSQVRQSAHFAGSGANSLNSKNSKTSAPSMHDVRIEVDGHAARGTAGQAKKTNKPNAASINGTNTIPGSKSGSGGGGRDGEAHCISPASAAGAQGNQGGSFGLAAAFHKRNSNPEHPPQADNRGVKEQDRPKSQLQMNNYGQRIAETSGKGSKSPLGFVSTPKKQGAGAGLSKAASKVVQVAGQEDFDEVDESEIEYDGEEKAHDKVNQIPNSQVNRNQQSKDIAATSAVQLGAAQNSLPGGAGAARDARSALGGAPLSGGPTQPADSPSPHNLLEDMLAGNSSALQSQNFEHAQQYTMKSLTINNINAGNSSSENQAGMAGLAMSGSIIGSQVNSQGLAGLYYAGPGGQLSGGASVQHPQRSGAAGLGVIAPSMNFYGQMDGQSPQTVTNNNSKASSSHQNMYELQSQGAIFQAHQLRAGEDILRSQSYHGTSSNRKHAMIGENGQISPVSHNSMANFTENDHKFSFGSYAPSHLSSYGAPGPAGHQKGLGQLEVGQIRMSLLNFASSQLQMQNSSVSGGGAAGPSRISPQNGQNLVTNSVSSHRPLHERETIEREIRKHSRPGGADPHNTNNGLVTSPKGFGGVQMPVPGRSNIQKVFMLHDIILAPQSQSTQAQLGLMGGGVPGLPGLSHKTPTSGKQNAADNSLGIIKQKNLEKSAARAKSKEDEIIDTGARGSHDGAGAHHQGLLIELDGKHLTNATNIHENATQSKNSHPTATTAGNSNTGNTASVVGVSHQDRGHHKTFNNSADPFMLPIGVVEGFYAPIIYEKSQEIERIRRRVQGYKRERYGCAREFKNQRLLQKQLHEENLNLRKQINLLMIAKLGRKPPLTSESSTDASGVAGPTSSAKASEGRRGGPQAASSNPGSKQSSNSTKPQAKDEDPRRRGNNQAANSKSKK